MADHRVSSWRTLSVGFMIFAVVTSQRNGSGEGEDVDEVNPNRVKRQAHIHAFQDSEHMEERERICARPYNGKYHIVDHSCIFLGAQLGTWEESRAGCNKVVSSVSNLRATLVRIQDDQMMRIVDDLLEDHNNTEEGAWIGLHYTTEGYKWDGYHENVHQCLSNFSTPRHCLEQFNNLAAPQTKHSVLPHDSSLTHHKICH